jgi:ribosomal protein S18 acetylase RimI-like enzyme
MSFMNTTVEDLDVLEELYDEAIAYQRSQFAGHFWNGMNRALITKEIKEGLHWKIVEAGQIACFFSMLHTDPLVWDQRDAEPSLYLHRIVTNPSFRGRGYVKQIIAWAEAFGKAAGKQYVRLDTGRENSRLNEYYQQCGLVFCGIKQFEDASNPDIPRHYLGSGLNLYEKRIE